MKMMNFSAVAAAMLIGPVLLCSCRNDAKTEKKAEPAALQQESKSEPQTEEVKAEPKLNNGTPQEKSAVAEKKIEPASAAATPAAAPAPAATSAATPAAATSAPAPTPAAAATATPVATPAPVVAPVQEKKADKPDPQTKKHLVRTGDNLWKISRKYYGSGSEWKRIYEANKTEIKNKDFLEPGTILTIPAAK